MTNYIGRCKWYFPTMVYMIDRVFILVFFYTFLISIMSLDSSSNHPIIPDLYCSEVTSEVIHLDSDDEAMKLNVLWGDSDHDDSDESILLSLLESEHDQVQEQTKSLGQQLRKKTWLINAREEAINWILKVHMHTLLASYVQSIQSSNMSLHCNQFLIVTVFSWFCRCMLTTVSNPRQHIFL